MPQKTEPQFKPLEFLPLFQTMIFDMLKGAKEQYQSLLEVRKKPHVLDDQIVNRMIKAYTEQLDDHWLWEKQLDLWQKLEVTSSQKQEIHTLREAVADLKATNENILNLTKEIQPHTIDKVLAKDDLTLAQDFLNRNTSHSSHSENLFPKVEETLEKMVQMETKCQKIQQTLNKIFVRFTPQLPSPVAEACGERLGIRPEHLQNAALRNMFAD